jgi:phosphate transport system substrate-binding protein
MSDAELAQTGNDTLVVPVTAGCVVLAYNLPGFHRDLKLSRKAYAGIFLGSVTNWNDPIIARSNPDLKLPDLSIAPVVRLDSSGTTFAFTGNLAAISDEWRSNVGQGTLVNWPSTAIHEKGNDGVAGTIQRSPGSIGCRIRVCPTAQFGLGNIGEQRGQVCTAVRPKLRCGLGYGAISAKPPCLRT